MAKSDRSEKNVGLFELGIPVAWQTSQLPMDASAVLIRDFRRKEPTVINSIMAMYAEVFRKKQKSPTFIYIVYALIRGYLRWPKIAIRAMRQQAGAARREYGRSLFNQALDMWRAWQICNLPPNGYYEGHIARHSGGIETTGYIPWPVLGNVVIALQHDTFGAPPFNLNDKAEFGNWSRKNNIRCPREIVLESQAQPPSADTISALGNAIFVKPRVDLSGRNTEAWTLSSDKKWRFQDRVLTSPELSLRLHQHAVTTANGIVIQERLQNHDKLKEICGTALSTCRVVTILDENNNPEITECAWRMAMRPEAIVDNYHAGGMSWIAGDMVTGEIDHGIDPTSTRCQELLSHHPITGQKMAGYSHPFWPDIRELAIKTHEKLGGVVIVGWDIAVTPDGPTLIEMNFPAGLSPRSQVPWNGLENSRLGQILARRALRWLKNNVDKKSRSRITG